MNPLNNSHPLPTCFAVVFEVSPPKKRRWGRGANDLSREELRALGLNYGDSDSAGPSEGRRGAQAGKIAVTSMKLRYMEGWRGEAVRGICAALDANGIRYEYSKKQSSAIKRGVALVNLFGLRSFITEYIPDVQNEWDDNTHTHSVADPLL